MWITRLSGCILKVWDEKYFTLWLNSYLMILLNNDYYFFNFGDIVTELLSKNWDFNLTIQMRWLIKIEFETAHLESDI